MFRFTKDGRLQSQNLLYAFFLGLGLLFVHFLIGNLLSVWIEPLVPAWSRAAKNAFDILVPALIAGALSALLFRLLKRKKIVLMACWFEFLLTVIFVIAMAFQYDADTVSVLLLAFLGIFVVPAAVSTAVVTIQYVLWRRRNPDPIHEEQREIQAREDEATTEESA